MAVCLFTYLPLCICVFVFVCTRRHSPHPPTGDLNQVLNIKMHYGVQGTLHLELLLSLVLISLFSVKLHLTFVSV